MKREFYPPNYKGQNICNIIPSIARIFHIETEKPGLSTDVFPEERWHDVKKVVLLIIDSLGYEQLLHMIDRRISSLLKLIEKAELKYITSTFPSTTTTALTSIYTGDPPGMHGIIGYQMWLKEIGVTANMISLTPLVDGERDRLLKVGVNPRDFLWSTPILKEMEGKIEHYHLIKRIYRMSGLSTLFFESVTPFVHLSDMIITIKNILEEKEKVFITAYWDDIDTISHLYGPLSEEIEKEVEILFYSLNMLINSLSEKTRKTTLFILTADHGHLDVDRNEYVYLSRYPFIKKRLLMQPVGEFRAAYLFVKHGSVEELKEYMENKFPSLIVFRSEDALKNGLFGSIKKGKDIKERVGDLIVVPEGKGAFVYLEEPILLKGRHGGMTKTEMLVPLILMRN